MKKSAFATLFVIGVLLTANIPAYGSGRKGFVLEFGLDGGFAMRSYGTRGCMSETERKESDIIDRDRQDEEFGVINNQAGK